MSHHSFHLTQDIVGQMLLLVHVKSPDYDKNRYRTGRTYWLWGMLMVWAWTRLNEMVLLRNSTFSSVMHPMSDDTVIVSKGMSSFARLRFVFSTSTRQFVNTCKPSDVLTMTSPTISRVHRYFWWKNRRPPKRQKYGSSATYVVILILSFSFTYSPFLVSSFSKTVFPKCCKFERNRNRRLTTRNSSKPSTEAEEKSHFIRESLMAGM